MCTIILRKQFKFENDDYKNDKRTFILILKDRKTALQIQIQLYDLNIYLKLDKMLYFEKQSYPQYDCNKIFPKERIRKFNVSYK